MNEQQEYYAKLWSGRGATYLGRDELSRMHEICASIESYGNVSKALLRILDLGCGTGWLGQFLLRFGEVCGADFEQKTLERAKVAFPNVDFVLLDKKAPLYGLQAGYFDVVVSSEVIEHVDDKRLFVEVTNDLLVAGGLLVLTTPVGEMFPLWAKWVKGQYQPTEKWITTDDLRRLVAECGFEPLSQKRFYYNRVGNSLQDKLLSVPLIGYVSSVRFLRPMWRWLTDRHGIYQIIVARKTEKK